MIALAPSMQQIITFLTHLRGHLDLEILSIDDLHDLSIINYEVGGFRDRVYWEVVREDKLEGLSSEAVVYKEIYVVTTTVEMVDGEMQERFIFENLCSEVLKGVPPKRELSEDQKKLQQIIKNTNDALPEYKAEVELEPEKTKITSYGVTQEELAVDNAILPETVPAADVQNGPEVYDYDDLICMKLNKLRRIAKEVGSDHTLNTSTKLAKAIVEAQK